MLSAPRAEEPSLPLVVSYESGDEHPIDGELVPVASLAKFAISTWISPISALSFLLSSSRDFSCSFSFFRSDD